MPVAATVILGVNMAAAGVVALITMVTHCFGATPAYLVQYPAVVLILRLIIVA